MHYNEKAEWSSPPIRHAVFERVISRELGGDISGLAPLTGSDPVGWMDENVIVRPTDDYCHYEIAITGNHQREQSNLVEMIANAYLQWSETFEKQSWLGYEDYHTVERPRASRTPLQWLWFNAMWMKWKCRASLGYKEPFRYYLIK